MTEEKPKRKRKPASPTGRKFAKLVSKLHERMNSSKESVVRESISTLASVLMHIDTLEDRKAARAARIKQGLPEPEEAAQTPQVDPETLAATIAKLQREVAGGNA